MCTGVEQYDQDQVIFCKFRDNIGDNLKIDNYDFSFITRYQILGELPVPNLKQKGQHIFYALYENINAYDRGS